MSAITQPTQALRVAGVQLNIVWEDLDENFSRASDLVARAAGGGAQLVVLPEMFATGFSMNGTRVAPYGKRTRDFLGELSSRHGIWILGGYAEPGLESGPGIEAGQRSLPRNACSLMGPDGAELLRYHKIHPFSLAGEHEQFEGGEHLPSALVEGVRVTPLICYDLRFPEPFRKAADRTDLFVVVANWPDQRVHAWSTLLAARAIENQAYVLGVNRVGEGDGLPYCGCSALLDPLGQTIASLAHQEGILTGGVDAAEVADIRRNLPFLEDRRTEIYRSL